MLIKSVSSINNIKDHGVLCIDIWFVRASIKYQEIICLDVRSLSQSHTLNSLLVNPFMSGKSVTVTPLIKIVF